MDLGAVDYVAIAIIIALMVLVGPLPRWPHAADWGRGPVGLVTALLMLLLIIVLIGRL